MNWSKKGLILDESLCRKFEISNPQVPYATVLTDRIRIFFGARKKDSGPAGIYSLDVELSEPTKIIGSVRPLLAEGLLGAFDQDGVLPVCIKKVGAQFYLYYGGFSRMLNRSHTCMMGLAISNNNCESFERISDGPIFPISKTDPYLIGSADVVFYNERWHMIYTSGLEWKKLESSLELVYTLKYANSKDGINWNQTGQIAIQQVTEFDAIAKPSIIKINDTFVMYFSKRQIVNYRKKGESAYSFGVATSKDLVHWKRDDTRAGIQVSESGWDSEMICYPNIIEVGDRYLMFYNGNGFGKSGFGYAEVKKELIINL